MFRLAAAADIDAVHELLVAEAARGHFDPRLAEEPYRSALRRNLNNIRKKGRRLDEEVAAQLLVWEQDGERAGCMINSAILPQSGNEIWMIAVLPGFRGQGVGRQMENELLAYLHPRVDIFARCTAQAKLAFDMFLRRGFLPLEVTDKGVRVLKLPKLGSNPRAQADLHQVLEPFVEIPVAR